MTSVLALALALSMDAFAAALGRGASARPRADRTLAFKVGLAFGAAQALMPILGWSLGIAFAAVARDVDHWLVLVLLGGLGSRMAWRGFHGSSDEVADSTPPRRWTLFALAIATSVDAAAAGVAIPSFGVPILVAATVIGVVTLVVSAAGVLIGSAAGAAAGRHAELVGGLVLVGLGIKIFVEHQFLN